jgi:hypothetical protein
VVQIADGKFATLGVLGEDDGFGGELQVAEITFDFAHLNNRTGEAVSKQRSLIGDAGAELGAADGTLLRDFIDAAGALHAHAHVSAGCEDHVGGTGEADGALLVGVALEEVVGPVDVLQVESQVGPLNTCRSTSSDCDRRL